MIQQERHFQYLIALAVSGQISGAELEELSEHMANCSSCSQRMAEMESTNFQLFLTLAADIKKARVSSKMRERFLMSAAHAGAILSAPSPGFQRSSRLHFAAFLVAVCLIAGMGWRRATERSLRRTIGTTLQVEIPLPAQLSSAAGLSGLALPATLVAERSLTGPHHNRRAYSKATTLPAFAMSAESRVVARPLFRLDSAFSLNQPRAIDNDSRPSNLQDVASDYLHPRGADTTPRFSTPTIWSSGMGGDPNQRVFRYSATLASISVQDDQAVFGLKPRVRDISLSNALGSIRPR
jgi:anti-sigma factor RsiW